MNDTDYISKVANEFNQWHDRGRADSMENEHIIAVEAALKEMNISGDMKTLDIGCGNGYTTRLIAKLISEKGKATGIDISENMIKTAKEKSLSIKNTEFLVANFLNLPFEDNFFDIIISVESIYYAEDLNKALKEIKRVLKQKGKFYCISYFFKEHKYSKAWADYIPLKMHYLSENEYIKALEKTGFKDIYTKRVYDERPVDVKNFQPKWGYNTPEELINFKKDIGALLVVGKNAN